MQELIRDVGTSVSNSVQRVRSGAGSQLASGRLRSLLGRRVSALIRFFRRLGGDGTGPDGHVASSGAAALGPGQDLTLQLPEPGRLVGNGDGGDPESDGRNQKFVVIGGGTGLSRLLRGLKFHVGDLVAIITVADDGGSSGRLRSQLGVLPPGDFRQCIAALAAAEPLLVELFEHRFLRGDELKGHSFGNLFIAAMSEITGSFEQALQESAKVLAVRGQIMPSTFQNVGLCAELQDKRTILGESQIAKGGSPIRRVYLSPEKPRANAKAVGALLDADVIVVGPGSLYTSILPNLLIPEIAAAIRASTALRIYVCNVATQPGESDGYDLEDHVRAIESHVGTGIFDWVLVNDNFGPAIPSNWPASHVRITGGRVGACGVPVKSADLVDEARPTQHEPEKLARAIMRIADGDGLATGGDTIGADGRRPEPVVDL